MNYTLDFNLLDQLEVPQVILCNRNKKHYGELYPVEDLQLTMNADKFHELSFKIPRTINGQTNPYWDKIVDLKVVYLQKFGYFQIEVDRSHDGIVEYKCITAQSLEVELGQLYLNDFEINSDELLEDENEEPIVFYNPYKPELSLLHKVLEKAPAWNIAHVDKELWNKQRTFDVNQKAIYDFLTGDVADELKCTFQFDTFHRTISVYLVETYGKDTTLYFSHENLIQELKIQADAGEIKNCFKVIGGDDILINNVNPNGTDYIWNLTEEDRLDMSKQLTQKLADYDILYADCLDGYEKIMTEIGEQITKILDLQEKAPEDANTTDWTKLSLTYLKNQEKSVLATEDVYKDQGYGLPTSSNYQNYYLPNHNTLLAIQAEIVKRNAEIEAAQKVQDELESKMKDLQEKLDLKEYLGNDLWLELSLYRREDVYENSNYSATEITTDEENFEMTKELFNEAVTELKKASAPKYEFSTSMNNILAHPKFREHAKDFALWDYIRVGINDDQEIVKVRLISFTIDFGNIADINVSFSDMTTIHNAATQGKDVLNQAQSAATSYNTIKRQYDKAKNSISMVDQIRKEGLEGDLFDIKNSTDADIVINDRGILCRKWNPQKQDYELEQLHIINNKIVMTDDNWNSARMSIGQIHFNGQNLYGVNADVIVGDMILSKSLNIHNANSSISMDGDGAEFYNCGITLTDSKNTLKMHPKQENIFEISQGGVKKIWFDTNGNANFSGHITASTINIGYGAFQVFESGDCFITRGSIKIGPDLSKPNFSVDINGNLIARSAVITSSSDDSSAQVTLKEGNVLLKGQNGYLRHSKDGEEYSKIIGVSMNENVVIGHDQDVWSVFGGQAFKNINMYARERVTLSVDSLKENVITLNASTGLITCKDLRINGETAATKSYVDSQYQKAYSAGFAAGVASVPPPKGN